MIRTSLYAAAALLMSLGTLATTVAAVTAGSAAASVEVA